MNLMKNISEIKEDIYKYSKNPEIVKLVAVTKYVDVNIIKELINCGIKDFGENRVQVLKDKRENLKDEDIKWHMIGQLQKNKVKYLIDFVYMIHSIDSYDLATEIDKRAQKENKILNVLIEVNISGENTKTGFSKEELIKNCEKLISLKNINICGLMTMAPLNVPENEIRNVFSGLREFKDELNNKFFKGNLKELSMGMSNDYKIALEEGSTIIRIGTKIFK